MPERQALTRFRFRMSTQSKYFNQVDSNDIKGGLYTVDSMLELYKMNATTHFKDGMLCYITKYGKYYRYVQRTKKWMEVNLEMVELPDTSVNIDGTDYNIIVAGRDYDQLLQELIQLKYSAEAQANLDLNMRKFPSIYYDAEQTFQEWVKKCKRVAWELINGSLDGFSEEDLTDIFDFRTLVDIIDALYAKLEEVSENTLSRQMVSLDVSLLWDVPDMVIYDGQSEYTINFEISAELQGQPVEEIYYNYLKTEWNDEIVFDTSVFIDSYEYTIHDVSPGDYTFTYEIIDIDDPAIEPVVLHKTIQFVLPYYIGSSPRQIINEASNEEKENIPQDAYIVKNTDEYEEVVQSEAEPVMAEAAVDEVEQDIIDTLATFAGYDVTGLDWSAYTVGTIVQDADWQQLLSQFNRHLNISLLSTSINKATTISELYDIITNAIRTEKDYIKLDWSDTVMSTSSVPVSDNSAIGDSKLRAKADKKYNDYVKATSRVKEIIADIIHIDKSVLETLLMNADAAGKPLETWDLLYTAQMQRELIERLNVEDEVYTTSLQTAGSINNLIMNVFDMYQYADEHPDDFPKTYFEGHPTNIYPSAVNGINALNTLKYNLEEDEPEDVNPYESMQFNLAAQEEVFRNLYGTADGPLYMNCPERVSVNIPIDGWFVWICLPQHRTDKQLRVFCNGFIFPISEHPLHIKGTYGTYLCYRSKWPLGLEKAEIPFDLEFI